MKPSWEIVVAARYLWMARKRAHSAFLSGISTLGLAVGVATLLVSLALLSGLQEQIRRRLIASSPQLLVEPSRASTIEDSAGIVAAIREQGMKDVEPVIRGIAWATPAAGGRGQPVRLRSYEPGKAPDAEVSFGRTWALEGEDKFSIYATRGWAASLGATLGDEIAVVAPRMELTPFGPSPVWKRFRITRFVAGSEIEGADAYLPFREMSRLFGTGGRPTAIVVSGAPTEATDAARDIVAKRYPATTVKTWKELNRPLFLALRLEKVVMFATISLIILVAALNLVASLSMTIAEKKAQIGILRTLGATEGGVLRVFLSVGLLIGLIGTTLGDAVGLGFSLAAGRWGFVPLPGDLALMGHVPFRVEMRDVVIVNLIAVVLSVAAAWYPARMAARVDPVVAIRGE